MSEFGEGRRSPSRRIPSNSSGRGSGAGPCAAAGELERSLPLPPLPTPPQQGRERAGTHPGPATQPQSRERVGGTRMRQRSSQARRPPRPARRPGCGLLLPPGEGGGGGARKKEGKKRRGPLPHDPPPLPPLSAEAAAPHSRARAAASPADRGVWAGERGGRAGKPKGRKGKVSVNPPVSAATPGQWVWLSSGCPARSRLPPAPLGRSPPRHTRWRRSAATSVPAPRAAPRVTEEGSGGRGRSAGRRGGEWAGLR